MKPIHLPQAPPYFRPIPSPDSYRLVRTATQSISMSNGPGHIGTHVNIQAGGSFGK
jgi:hypothetical protein